MSLSTLIKSEETFVSQDGAEWSKEAVVFGWFVWLVDLSYFYDLEGLHNQNLSAASHPAWDETFGILWELHWDTQSCKIMGYK